MSCVIHGQDVNECVCRGARYWMDATLAARAELARAKEFSVGQRVVYRPAFGPCEEGTVTSIGSEYVFVCYGLPGSTSKATRPADLDPVHAPVSTPRSTVCGRTDAHEHVLAEGDK